MLNLFICFFMLSLRKMPCKDPIVYDKTFILQKEHSIPSAFAIIRLDQLKVLFLPISATFSHPSFLFLIIISVISLLALLLL